MRWARTTSKKDNIKCCENGFHACEFPLEVFNYYAPGENSRYCTVTQSGEMDKREDDSKVASSKIHIETEIGLGGIIKAGVKFILDKVNWKDKKATNTGDYSAAKVSGKDSVAVVTGRDSKAAGALGDWIVLTERDDWSWGYRIKDVKAFKVDGKKIKANTFYKLVDGEAVEA